MCRNRHRKWIIGLPNSVIKYKTHYSFKRLFSFWYMSPIKNTWQIPFLVLPTWKILCILRSVWWEEWQVQKYRPTQCYSYIFCAKSRWLDRYIFHICFDNPFWKRLKCVHNFFWKLISNIWERILRPDKFTFCLNLLENASLFPVPVMIDLKSKCLL